MFMKDSTEKQQQLSLNPSVVTQLGHKCVQIINYAQLIFKFILIAQVNDAFFAVLWKFTPPYSVW